MLKEVLQQLKTAQKPIVKTLKEDAGGRVLLIGLAKGVTLKEHLTNVPAQLLIIDGCVNYSEKDKNELLVKLDLKHIPVGVLHWLEAKEHSLCLLLK